MITEGISKALADLRAAGCDADADRIESALTKAVPFGYWLSDCNGIGRFTCGINPDYVDQYRTTPGYSATPLYANAPPANPPEAGVTDEMVDSICVSLYGGCFPTHQRMVRDALTSAPQLKDAL